VSIAIAIISIKGAAIYSDGLVYDLASAGQVPVIRTDFNKTFATNNLVGACTGIMDLNGNSPQTVAQILAHDPSPENLKSECRKLLNQLTNCPPNARHLEILYATMNLKGPVCYRILLPVNATQDTLEELPHDQKKGPRRYALIGEQKARLAAEQSIKIFGDFERAGKTSISHMRKLVEDAVRAGIKDSGDHPSFRGYKACGGKLFSRTLDFD